MRRALKFILKDGTSKEIEISSAAVIPAPIPVEGAFPVTILLHLFKGPKGNRLIWAEELVKEFADLERIDIIRED